MSKIYPDLHLFHSDEEDVGDDDSVIAPFRLVLPEHGLCAPTPNVRETFGFDANTAIGDARLFQPRPRGPSPDR